MNILHGYLIELRFLDNEIAKIFQKKKKEELVIEYLNRHSLENKNLYIWDFYKKVGNDYMKITITKKLADLIQKNIDIAYEKYLLKINMENFNI